MVNLKKIITDEEIIKLNNLSIIIWNECFKEMLSKAQIDYMVNKFLSFSSIKNYILDKYNYFFIENDNDTIGYVCYKEYEEELFLSKLYITKPWRGKKISKFVIEELVKFRKNIRLTVYKYNSTAINAYKKLGFEITDSVITDIGNGYVMDDFIMIKKNLL